MSGQTNDKSLYSFLIVVKGDIDMSNIYESMMEMDVELTEKFPFVQD